MTATLHATRAVKRRIILSTPLKDVAECLKNEANLPADWKLSADVESIKKV